MKVHSNGRVIDYGKKGHPIVSDFYNPEYVVLKQYSKKPKVGDIIQFQVYRKKNQKCGKMIDKNKKVIYSSDQVEIDDILQLQIAKGTLTAKVLDKGNKNA